jgi:methionine aminopeptidase
MRTSVRLLSAGCLIALGYVMGSCQVMSLALAQPDETPISEDAAKKIVEAHDSLKKAMEQLKLDSRYESVTKGVNSYAVLVGGVNARDDLESGHGVDPETFAALNVAAYQLKKNNIKDDQLADWVDTNLLGYDSNGHLTYRNKVVRIYSISRMRKLNAQRMVVLGETKDSKPGR